MSVANIDKAKVLPRYASVAELVAKRDPITPVYALYPDRFRAAAKRFLDGFAGHTLYAVKANPAPRILDQVHAAGIRHFDTASVAEIALVRGRFPDAHCHFMAPVRFPGAAREARENFGVRDYVIDADSELDKLLAETGGGKGLRIFVRLATPLGSALIELSSKFGTTPDDGARLLKRVAASGAEAAITFHVGSQCLSPFSYAQAIEIARRTADLSGVPIAALDVGGGFPGPYLGNDVPPYHWYFDTIREAFSTFPDADRCELLCEPGRALVAEGVGLVTRIVSRRDDRLYLNDGIHGSLDELTLPGWTADYPRRVLTRDADANVRERTGATMPFKVFGPTCDTLDVLPRPLILPSDIAEGDFIVFETIGAYSAALRTGFNGFYPDEWAIVDHP